MNAFRGTLIATGTASSAAQSLQRFETTAGLAGSLTVNRVERPSGATWTNAINIGSAANATLTISGAVNSPVNLAGGLASGSLSFGTLNSTLAVPGTLGGSIAGTSIASTGSLSLGSVPSGRSVTISGITAGPITLSGSMSGSVAIGGSLAGTLALPAGGLVGQVVIGADSPFTSSWTGSPTIGGIALSNPPKSTLPAYRHPSMSYGNGAIALAPFRLYGDDCMPMMSGSGIGSLRITPLTDGSEPAVIAFYGPISRRPPSARRWSSRATTAST